MRFSVVLGLFLVGLVLSVGVASAADPYGNDRYRIIHVNSSIDGALSDFQVGNGSEPFVIEYDSDMQPDFDDIRMYYDSNMTEISYWFENVVNSTNASGYMKLDVPAVGGVDVRLYYSNSTISTTSSIDDTFILGDVFNDAAIDTGIWDTTNKDGTWNEASGVLTGSDGDGFWIRSKAVGTDYHMWVYGKASDMDSAYIMANVDVTTDPWGNGYAFRALANTDDLVITRAGSQVAIETVTLTANTYYYHEIKKVSGSLTYKIYDSSKTLLQTVTYNDGTPLTGNRIAFRGYAETLTTDWIILGKSTATEPTITIGAEQFDTLLLDINTTLTSPINNTYTQYNNFTFNIAGNFSSANATIFIDTIEKWNGSITTGPNTASNITLTEGLHSWYINATATLSGNTTYNLSSNESFYYDISNPTVPTVQITPDYATISDGTIVKINLSWADNLQLKNGTFYIDTGSGYSEDSNTTLSGVSDWFNTSINTSGMVGNIITWKQEVYDQAGNNYTYSDSFYVALPSLLIYVYDETTGMQILPSDVTVYNEDVSRSAAINGSTNISTLNYGNFTTGKYIVRVSAEGYYTRRSIALIDIETVSSLNVYLPDLNETVIFDQFILTDNTLLYDLSDCIIRLSKPLPNGTDTVFSSYFDFDGVASTYLIATDQYILYIETPDSVISYGWLTPDADGRIEIVITDPIEDLLDDWLSYSLTKSDAGSISLSYESDDVISSATFYVNTTGGTVLYTASITADTGSFTYAADVNESYWVSFTAVNVDGDVKTVTQLIYWNEDGPQPERLPLLPDDAPDWLYNLLSVGVIIIVVLLFSQIRADAACILGAAFSGMFWFWGWLKISGIVIAVAALIAVAAIMYKSRREGI